MPLIWQSVQSFAQKPAVSKSHETRKLTWTLYSSDFASLIIMADVQERLKKLGQSARMGKLIALPVCASATAGVVFSVTSLVRGTDRDGSA